MVTVTLLCGLLLMNPNVDIPKQATVTQGVVIQQPAIADSVKRPKPNVGTKPKAWNVSIDPPTNTPLRKQFKLNSKFKEKFCMLLFDNAETKRTKQIRIRSPTVHSKCHSSF